VAAQRAAAEQGTEPEEAVVRLLFPQTMGLNRRDGQAPPETSQGAAGTMRRQKARGL